jgi:hypothetical protein
MLLNKLLERRSNLVRSFIWGPTIDLKSIVRTDSKGNLLRVTSIYVDKNTGRIIIEYDDQPKE